MSLDMLVVAIVGDASANEEDDDETVQEKDSEERLVLVWHVPPCWRMVGCKQRSSEK